MTDYMWLTYVMTDWLHVIYSGSWLLVIYLYHDWQTTYDLPVSCLTDCMWFTLCHVWLTTCDSLCVMSDWLHVIHSVSCLTDCMWFTLCHVWLTTCDLLCVMSDWLQVIYTVSWFNCYYHGIYLVSWLNKCRLHSLSRCWLTTYGLRCVADAGAKLAEAQAQFQERETNLQGRSLAWVSWCLFHTCLCLSFIIIISSIH